MKYILSPSEEVLLHSAAVEVLVIGGWTRTCVNPNLQHDRSTVRPSPTTGLRHDTEYNCEIQINSIIVQDGTYQMAAW